MVCPPSPWQGCWARACTELTLTTIWTCITKRHQFTVICRKGCLRCAIDPERKHWIAITWFWEYDMLRFTRSMRFIDSVTPRSGSGGKASYEIHYTHCQPVFSLTNPLIPMKFPPNSPYPSSHHFPNIPPNNNRPKPPSSQPLPAYIQN